MVDLVVYLSCTALVTQPPTFYHYLGLYFGGTRCTLTT